MKDRPCAVVVALKTEEGRTRVYVLPITHSVPDEGDAAIESPALVEMRLGLDSDRSWVVVREANEFIWPGPDLRFLPGKRPKSAVYGFLPPGCFRVVRERFLAIDRQWKSAMVSRTS